MMVEGGVSTMMGRVDVGGVEAGVLLGRGGNDSHYHTHTHSSRLHHRWVYREEVCACGVTLGM